MKGKELSIVNVKQTFGSKDNPINADKTYVFAKTEPDVKPKSEKVKKQ